MMHRELNVSIQSRKLYIEGKKSDLSSLLNSHSIDKANSAQSIIMKYKYTMSNFKCDGNVEIFK